VHSKAQIGTKAPADDQHAKFVSQLSTKLLSQFLANRSAMQHEHASKHNVLNCRCRFLSMLFLCFPGRISSIMTFWTTKIAGAWHVSAKLQYEHGQLWLIFINHSYLWEHEQDAIFTQWLVQQLFQPKSHDVLCRGHPLTPGRKNVLTCKERINDSRDREMTVKWPIPASCRTSSGPLITVSSM